MTLISLCSISLLITNFAAWTFISWLNVIVRVNVVLNRTVAVDSEWNLCDSHLQSKKKKMIKKEREKKKRVKKGSKKGRRRVNVWSMNFVVRIAHCILFRNIVFSFIMKLSQRIKLRSNSERSNFSSRCEDTEYFHKTFPFFIWLLRDVTQSIPPDCTDLKDYFLTRVSSFTSVTLRIGHLH